MNAELFMEELSKRGVFFLKEKATQKLLMNESLVLTGMDGMTADPRRAQLFVTKIDAISFMVKHDLKLVEWCIV